MVLPPMYTETYTKYRQDQLYDEAEHERLVLRAGQPRESRQLSRKPAYCCITGDVQSGFELGVEDAA